MIRKIAGSVWSWLAVVSENYLLLNVTQKCLVSHWGLPTATKLMCLSLSSHVWPRWRALVMAPSACLLGPVPCSLPDFPLCPLEQFYGNLANVYPHPKPSLYLCTIRTQASLFLHFLGGLPSLPHLRAGRVATQMVRLKCSHEISVP